jgi:phosphoribosylaminoimidazole synthetase/phosphoribosylamine--glycine ligase
MENFEMCSEMSYKVMILGSGGRENAMAYYFNDKCQVYIHSDNLNEQLYNLISKNYTVGIMDSTEILKIVLEVNPDVVIVGSESLLITGVVDLLVKKGILVLGPNKKMAKIESSKIFARRFLRSLNLDNYNPDYMVIKSTDNLDAFEKFWDLYKGNIVIKQDSLAGGKGVFVSGDHFNNTDKTECYNILNDIHQKHGNVLLEEKLNGLEFSLITLRDRNGHCQHFPPVRDFKRRYDNDEGPNTGGMGSISLIVDDNNKHWINQATHVNQMILDELDELYDDHYVGFLYGSYMLTEHGLKVIEFNARMGDPEAIGLFKSLKTKPDLLIKNLLNGTLDQLKLEFCENPYVVKYLVPEIYPNKCNESCKFIFPTLSNIENSVALRLNEDLCESLNEHACEKSDIDFLKHVYQNKNVSIYLSSVHLNMEDNLNYLGGSRTLAIVCSGSEHISASLMINKILAVFCKINKNIKLDFRVDIGLKNHHWIFEQPKIKNIKDVKQLDYAESGVNVDTNQEVVQQIKAGVVSTHVSPHNLGKFCSGYGQFAGMIKLKHSKRLFGKNIPIIAGTTDGTGTKSLFATNQLGIQGFYSLGQDLVNHCVNDLMVQGAQPLFFLDYFASSLIKPEEVKTFIEGCAVACIENNCMIAGGETAEMPDVYLPNVHDLVGTMIGIVEGIPLDPVKNIKLNDIALALPSSGPHTNGYSLIRKVIKAVHERGDVVPEPIINEWLTPHRSYKKDFDGVNKLGIKVKGYAHITGGGLIENPPRILPDNLGLEINTNSWVMSDGFQYIQEETQISNFEMRKTFNCGVGLIIIIDPNEYQKLIRKLSSNPDQILKGLWRIGTVVNRKENNDNPVYFI